jgi:hydrogenase large subunit
MPVLTAAIDPVTRIEGHLKVEVDVDKAGGVQQVVDARAVGTLFRGFEKILENRDPRDATQITSRICGVCPTSHGMASALALDQAFGVRGDTPERTNARLLRNLVHGACYLESHLLHFYLLSLPDYIPGLPVAPWLPGWQTGARCDSETRDRFTAGLREAIRMRRQAHEIAAIFGGRLPHTPAFVAGGMTTVPSPEDQALFAAGLGQILEFIERTYLPDVQRLASLFKDYFHWGKGYGHLLSFGAFELDNADVPALLFARGWKSDAAPAAGTVDEGRVRERVTHSWYQDQDDDRHPALGDTRPLHPKAGAYSWLKAPRYDGWPAECGPLARQTLTGDYRNGVSVMDRHLARAQEALKLGQSMRRWVMELIPDVSAYTPCAVPDEADTAVGLTEAPRGALGHWLRISHGKIAHYQVLTPTCWNVSPRDGDGQRGPLEQALIGLPVENIDQPIEVLRVIHSFDPCLDCATHVAQLAKDRAPVVLARALAKPNRPAPAIDALLSLRL